MAESDQVGATLGWRDVTLTTGLLCPQVLFEALISPDHKGYIGLDDILLFSYPCGESQSTRTEGCG